MTKDVNNNSKRRFIIALLFLIIISPDVGAVNGVQKKSNWDGAISEITFF